MVRRQYSTRQQPFERHVTHAVHLQEFPDLVQIAIVRQQLLFGGEVNAVEAGKSDRRTTDPHVYLPGSGLTQRPDLAPGGRAANDGVVHDHDALTPDNLVDHRQLELDFQLSGRLVRRDERSADVMASHQSHIERYSTVLGVSQGR